MMSDEKNHSGSHSENISQSSPEKVKLPPAVEGRLQDLRLLDSAEEEEKTSRRDKRKLEQFKQRIAQHPRFSK